MESSVFQLGVVVSLTDLAKNKILAMHDHWKDLRNKMDDASNAAKRFDKGMSMLKTGIDTLGASAGLYSFANNLSDSAKEAGKLESNIRSLGVSKSEVEAISSEVGKMASTMGISKETFLTGVYDIKSGISSLDGATLPKFAESIAITAKATKGDFAELSKLFAMTYNQYKSSYSKMSDLDFGNMVGNTLSLAVKKYRTDGSAMNQAMNSLGSSAQAIGITLTEQTAVLGTLQNTMNPGEAGTAYRAFLGKIGTGLEKLGLSSVDANNKLKSMPAILEEIKNKYGSSIDTQKEMPQLISAFGEEGVKAILNLLPHTKALENDIKELGSAADSLDFSAMREMSNQNLSSYSSQLDRLDSGWKALKSSLGSALAEGPFKNAVSMIADFVGWTLNLVESSPIIKDFFGYFLIGASVLGAVIGLMSSLSGVAMIYTATTQSLGASILYKTGMLFLNSGALAVNTVQHWISIAASKAETIARSANIAVLGIERTSMSLSVALYAVKTGVMTKATFAQWAFNAALSANPIGAVVVGVVALIGVVVLAVKYFEVWTGWIKSLGSSVMNLYNEHQMLVSVVLALIGPIGWLINGALLLAQNWDKVTQSIQDAYNWFRKFTGTSDATIQFESGLKDVNKQLDDLYTKRDKASKFGLDSEVSKYDSEIKKLEANKNSLETNIQKESEYQKMLKDTNALRDSLKSEVDKGNFGKAGSSEYEAAQKRILDLDKKAKLSKDEFLKSNQATKAVEETNKLSSATENLGKKINAVPKNNSALGIIGVNDSANFNGGNAQLPNLSNIKLPDKSFNQVGSKMETSMKSAVESVPVSMTELTSKLEKVLSDSGKKLGESFSAEFQKALQGLRFRDIEVFFMRNMNLIFAKLNGMGFNAGRNLVNTYSSGVGKETGGQQQVGTLERFTGVIKDFFNWSDAKRGPLARTTEAGSNLVKTYSTGINKSKNLLEQPLENILSVPKKEIQKLSNSISPENATSKTIQNQSNQNLNIEGINISLQNGLKGIGQILEDLIIQKAEAL